MLLSQFIITIIANFASLETELIITCLFAPPCFDNDFLLVLKIEMGSVFNLLCLQKSGAKIGEFLTPLIFLCHSYKKWTLNIVCIEKLAYTRGQ